MKMQKAVATRRLYALTLPCLSGAIWEHRQRAPDVGVAHNALCRNLLPVLQLHPHNTITVQQKRSHGDAGPKAAAVLLKALH